MNRLANQWVRPVVKSAFVAGGRRLGMNRAIRSFGTAPVLRKANDQQPSLPQQTGETDIAEQVESVVQVGGSDSSYPLLFQVIQTAMEKLHGNAMITGDIDGTLKKLDTLTTDSPDIPRHLQMMHLLDSGAVPWWAVIGGSAVVLRLLLTTPLYVRQQRARSTAQRMAVVAETWRHAFVESAKLKRQGGSKKQIDREVRRKHHQLMLREGCHPVETLLLPLAQAPVWITMSCVLRHMCGYVVWLFDSPGAHVEKVGGITWEGLAWFRDLSVPDPTLILPVTAALLHVANYALVRRQNNVPGVVNSEQSTGAKALRGLSFTGGYISPWLLVYMGVYQPSGLVLYWVVSAAFSLAQTVLFGIPRVRQIFRLPPLPSQTKVRED
ncbi:Cytochrome c oxidase assembly protein cox18, mitochondrial [Coemansia erecta]|uniref:Cytochrome c oxidase assembly protein cox18, mitochondrial n=1 Tax=Coemansia erecta TaxID=147472 RepID=A0A9W7XXK1_9FUNG|nr:Cytochrome c oxidase assembly protein cox18, mitochondrial [Coemansia erecta]